MNDYKLSKDNRIKPEPVITEEFFSYFYHFRDGVLHGDKSRAKHSLEQIKQYAENNLSDDLLRLAILGMAEVFSSHLDNKETVSLMKEVSLSAERAFERLSELIEICCE